MSLPKAPCLKIDKDHDIGLDLLDLDPVDDLRGPLSEDDIAFLEAWVDFAPDIDKSYCETPEVGTIGDIEVGSDTLVLATRKFALTQRLALLRADNVPAGPRYKTYGNAYFSPRGSSKALGAQQLYFNPLFGAPFAVTHVAEREEEDAPLLQRLRQEHLPYEYEALMRADMRDLEARDLIHWTPDELVDAELERDFNDPPGPVTPRTVAKISDCSSDPSCASAAGFRRNRKPPFGPGARSILLPVEDPSPEAPCTEDDCRSPGTPAARCPPPSCCRVAARDRAVAAAVTRLGDGGAAPAAAAQNAAAAEVGANADDFSGPAPGPAAAPAAFAPAPTVADAVKLVKRDPDPVHGRGFDGAEEDAVWRRFLDGLGQLPYEYEALISTDMRDLEEHDFIHWTASELVDAALARSFCQQQLPAPNDPWAVTDASSPIFQLGGPPAAFATNAAAMEIAVDLGQEGCEDSARRLNGRRYWGGCDGTAEAACSFRLRARGGTSDWPSLALPAAACLSVPMDFCASSASPTTPDASCVSPSRRCDFHEAVAAAATTTATAGSLGLGAGDGTAVVAAAAADCCGACGVKDLEPVAYGSRDGSDVGGHLGGGDAVVVGGGGGGSGSSSRGCHLDGGGGDSNGDIAGKAWDGGGGGDDLTWSRFLDGLGQLPYEYEALMRADMRDLEARDLIYWTPDELVDAALARGFAS